MHCNNSKTLGAQPQRNWDLFLGFSAENTSIINQWRQQNTISRNSSSIHQTKPVLLTKPERINHPCFSTTPGTVNPKFMKQIKTQELTVLEMIDDNDPPPTISASQMEEVLVRNENKYEFYIPLSFMIVLKRKIEILYVPLDFKDGLTKDDLVDPGAHVSAIPGSAPTDSYHRPPPTSSKMATLQILRNQLQMVSYNNLMQQPLSNSMLEIKRPKNTSSSRRS